MRGGTSRGAVLLKSDLPPDPELLDRVVLRIYGSPDARQIDGLGGGDALTSKVIIVESSNRPGVDVEYTFGQVGIETPNVYWVGNCGNMSATVAPFAISRGLVGVAGATTDVRMFNTNTRQTIVATVVTGGGYVHEEGPTRIAGVPGTGAPIFLNFGDCGGAVTGSILPTGRALDEVSLSDGTPIRISVVDAATPFVFVAAADIGMCGTACPSQIDQDAELLTRLEEVRQIAARMIGIIGPLDVAREKSPSIPRISVISPPAEYQASDGTRVARDQSSLVARQLSMQRAHKTYAVTGTLCTAVAARIPGTIVSELAVGNDEEFRIGHPGGIISARVRVDTTDGTIVEEASLVRTARVIMEGDVHVPGDLWPAGA